MGTWGAGSFENDSALDYIWDLQASPTYGFIKKTLEATIECPDEDDYSQEAIVAAEIVCILHGRLPESYDSVAEDLDPVIAILQNHPLPEDLRELAIQSIDSIAVDSALRASWEEADKLDEWMVQLDGIRTRLRVVRPGTGPA